MENLPVPKDLGKQNKRHHMIQVNGKDRTPGRFLKSGRILSNQKKGGGGKYNYGVAGDETKVYVDEVEGFLNKELVNHDAKIIDQFYNTSSVQLGQSKVDVEEDEEGEWEEGEEGYYDEEGGDDEDWEDEGGEGD